MKHIAALVLAAGAAERFGGGKLLEMLPNHKMLIQQVVDTVCDQAFNSVVLVLGCDSERISEGLKYSPVQMVLNPEWKEGISTSLKTGIRALPPDCNACMVFLGDQPFITGELIRALRETYLETNKPIVYPVVNGFHANPVLLDQVTFSAIEKLQGDVGARALFNQFDVQEVTWQHEQQFWDVDTPDDFLRIQSEIEKRNRHI